MGIFLGLFKVVFADQEKGGIVPIQYLFVLLLTICAFAEDQEQPTPYDMIRPVWPITWDSTVFDNFDTTVTVKKNMVPKNRTPADFAPNKFVPDTLNQAYLDAMNVKISPIRVNQAGYIPDDPEMHFYYVGTDTKFEVVDSTGANVLASGTFTATSNTTQSSWTILAGTNAATNDQKRYQVTATGPSGTIMVGSLAGLGLPKNERLRVKVGNNISSTFVISEDIYSMVRDATLKFAGINRSGNSESWFHAASHTLDGQGGPIVNNVTGSPSGLTKKGDLTGGWYDCGDHLKESQTQAYAFMVFAVLAATNPTHDADHYAYNQGETVNKDGIPDMLREAKHGADFFLKSYDLADGVIDNMAVSVGNFGADHGWWGRPENQDYIPSTVTGRGGPHERDVRLGELGSNISGQIAAGLALLSVKYAIYDSAFAAKCLKVSKEMYDFAKNLALGNSTYGNGKTFVNNKTAAGWSSPAYNGNNEFQDDLGLAAISLLYATQDASYLNDAVENTTFAGAGTQNKTTVAAPNNVGMFRGGWFAYTNTTLWKAGKNTSWANSYAYTLYTFYKLILSSEAQAAKFGISNAQRLEYAEDVIYTMIPNLSSVSGNGSSTIVLPSNGNWTTGSLNTVKYDPTWFNMMTDQTWIYNRYQAGNIFEVFAYADVAKDLDGVNLPQKGIQDWKAAQMQQLGINQMNYLLGVNPWDVSFLLGVGDKNDAHPHHRASNPEGKNVPGAPYTYTPPTGALFGGMTPGSTNAWVPSTKSWEDYHLSETCMDATATFIAAGTVASKSEDFTTAPTVQVEIRYVGLDSAIITVKTNYRSNVAISYSTNENLSGATAQASAAAGVNHNIVLRGLTNGTTYYFTATASNALNENNDTTKYLVDSTKTPYSFTTLNSMGTADIQNVKICNVSADSAEIMWYTPNGAYDSKVYWDTVMTTYDKMQWNTGNGNADVSGIPTKFHYVKIGGLKERTTYYYAVESNGQVVSVDTNGSPLKFTTPVTQYNFEVRTYQYHWADMSGININVFNNEARAFDSLTIRLYMRGKEDIYDDIGIRMDICQAYDEGGFNKPCSAETETELTTLFRLQRPTKIEDTYDAATGTWQWYFPIPLGSTVIKSSSRFRIDVLFDRRSRFAPYLDLTNASPDKKMYCKAGSSWYSPSDLAATSTLTENPGDWSWEPHSKANGDYADYTGMPCEDKDAGDIDFNVAPVNPYVTVYRKDEFVWGYSPSYTEMTTKHANYEMTVTLNPPFNVSNGSYVALDQSSSTVYVTGTAKVTEGGYITSIWVNGTAVKDLASAAVYDLATDKWNLKIPVKMTIGTNKIDLTIFAGPDPVCTACAEGGGCSFINRTYYVQFSKGDMTASSLRIVDANDAAISSPAEPGNTNFFIYVTDKDKANSGSIKVLVYNPRKNDTLEVTLTETSTAGTFKSATAIGAVSSTNHSKSEISFFGGDTVYVVYTDVDDEEDISQQSFYAEATYPTPQYALAQDLNCDGAVDNLQVAFSNAFDGSVTFDSLWVSFDATSTTPGDSFKVVITQDLTGLSTVNVPLSRSTIPVTASPSGYITAFLTTVATKETSRENAKITDGIAPILLSVTLLENPVPRSTQDTLKVSFTEPVSLASITAWPLAITNGTSTVSQTGISVIGQATTSDNGKSWTYVVEGNTDGLTIAANYTADIKANFSVSDLAFNSLASGTCNEPVTIAETPKPVPVNLAEMRDLTGDGIPDEVYLKFERKLRTKDMLDSFVVYWGNPSEARAFKLTTWAHTIEVGEPYYTYQGYVDSLNVSHITDSTLTRDTISIIKITIPKTQAYPLGTTTGSENGYGSVVPRLGPEGGFFDKSYSLVDKCPPIIMVARKTSMEYVDSLGIEISESLDSLGAGTYFIERRRGSTQEYLISDYGVMSSSQGQNWTLLYSENAAGAVRVGDYVRLIPTANLSKLKDKANNYAGDETPWVLVQGALAEKTGFEVTLLDAVATPPSSPYTEEAMPQKDEDFRLTVLTPAGTEQLIANGRGKLTSATATYDTSLYHHAGPTFKIDISMPSALGKVAEEPIWDFQISFNADIFDNLGHFINHVEYSFDLSDFDGYKLLSSDGILYLRLEWLAKDGIAPVADKGKKIGAGAFISKFNFNSKAIYMVDPVSEDDTYKKGSLIKTKDNITKTFGFRRVSK